MATFDELKDTYFAQVEDETPPSEMMPLTFSGCRITPLIDGINYNAEIDAALATVGTGTTEAENSDHFIFIANWWFGLLGGSFLAVNSLLNTTGPEVQSSLQTAGTYSLDPPANTKLLINVLKQKADAGVDVRLLPWVSFAVMDSNLAQMSGGALPARVNAFSMDTVKMLRAHPPLAKKCVLNVIGHTAGAVHNKFVLIGNGTTAVGFTGGIDFQMIRVTHVGHPGTEIWHDVMAKVEGDAVQAMYDHFQHMWQENVSRPVRRFRYEGADLPSFVPGTPVIPARTLAVADTGAKHHVQVLRTLPQFNYKWYNCLPENDPISFAPNGLFEYKLALRKAMLAATSYIYIEDQAHYSQETLGWANKALTNSPDVKVILLFPGSANPVDGEVNDAANLTQSINHGLLEGLSTGQRARVGLFRAFGDYFPIRNRAGQPIHATVVSVADDADTALVTTTWLAEVDMAADRLARKHQRIINDADHTLFYDIVGNPALTKGAPIVWRVATAGKPTPPTGTYIFSTTGIFVHAKTVLIDDVWAVIGSANNMRRSLYSDLEHGVSFMDEDGALVRDYRSALWADHFRASSADFTDLDAALHAWDPSWGSVSATVPPLAPWLEAIPIPVAEVAFTDKARKKYDWYEDVDSRQEWGGLTP